MAAGQFGGGRMGGIALAANGNNPQNFLAMPNGAIERLYLTVSMGLKSSGAAFAAVVSTGSSAADEGVDDTDLLLNALFTIITIFLDEATMLGALSPAQWRTILGLLNQSDFNGTWKNAVTIPSSASSATTFKIIIPIPISLASYFEDGGIFRNGSKRLRKGSIDYQTGSSLTPSVALANGTAVVSGLAVSLTAETGAGTEDDVGMTWSVRRLSGLPTTYDLGNEMRLAVLDTTEVAGNAASNVNIGGTELWTPADYGAKYQSERGVGSYDITARSTPYLWVEPFRKFLDFIGHLGRQVKIEAVSGVSSLGLYDVKAHPVPPGAVARVSTEVGAGGPVTISHPTPASLPPGSAIPPALQAFLPVRITPGRVGGGDVKATPSDAAADTLKKDLVAQRTGSIFRAFRR